MTHRIDHREVADVRSLLVPVDLSAFSDRVLGRVAKLPLAADAGVTLLHVVPDSLPPRGRRAAERDARKALLDEARELARSLPATITIACVVTVGSPASEIAARCAKTNIELIVMGRGGGRALRDTFLGSTAERVIRQARLPVLVVRLRPRSAYRRPALALDRDAAAPAVLAQYLRVVPAPRPRATVIHAYDTPFHGLIYPSLSEDDAAEYDDDCRQQARHAIEALLTGALDEANGSRAEVAAWTWHVQRASARTLIERTVKKSDADLLVLGTRARSGLGNAFLGTVAGDVLRAVACDVLVVPPADETS